MCWSYEVSIAFSSIEALLISFILIRSRLSTDPYVRKQWLLLPALTGICVMEAIEAYVWSRPDELIPIQETASSKICARVNHRLTLFVWLCILPWQPLWVVMPCRRVGHPDNRLLLKVPEFLCIVFALSSCALYLISSLPQQHFARRTLADSFYKSYLHNESKSNICNSKT